jgi:hypothetical protein
MIEQEDSPILNERRELKSIHEEALQYFDRNSAIEDNDPWPPKRDPDHYWSQIPTEDQKHVENLERRLIQTMAKIISAAKTSPLVSEADQRDLSAITKKMRAALRFHRYDHWDTDVIDD